MVLFLSKLLPIFIYPLGLSLLLAFIGLFGTFSRAQTIGRLTAALGVLILWTSATPVFGNWLLSTLERQYPGENLASIPGADVVIVLGGGLTEGADRELLTVRLFKAGKVKRVIVSGGNAPWFPAQRPEAELIKEFLVEWGIPANAIDLDTKSRNTYENAAETKEIWQNKPFQSALLVTSAYHMPRAFATFRRAGLPVRPCSAYVRAEAADVPDNALALLPDAGALATATKAIKEWLGLLIYKVVGYA